MKRLKLAFVVLLVLGLTAPVFGAEVTIHGDLNNRFMVYTNQSSFFKGAGYSSNAESGTITKDGTSDSWGETKYRMWVEGATNDGNVKGVYAIEMGSLRYGQPTAGDFSGDGINVETRWAYTDFQLPMVERKARIKLGLQPFKVNKYLWEETIMGAVFDGSTGDTDYQFGWLRGHDVLRSDTASGDDMDALMGRVDLKPAEGFKLGAYAVYNKSNANNTGANGTVTAHRYQLKFMASDTGNADKVDFEIWDLGIDGSYNFGNFFINYDLIYQTGDIDNIDFIASDGVTYSNDQVDVSAYFAHLDVGLNIGDAKITYTFWYASGDDNPGDGDFEGFRSTDVDSFDGVVLFEGYTDDNYFSERHYLLDKGFIMNKIALDYKVSEKLKVGAAVMYMMTAEDIEYTAAANGASVSESDIGVEGDVYFSYMLYKNLEFAVNAGYLVAGDAMDFWEEDSIQNGSSDEDIIKVGTRVRYSF
ncbi:MAG: alginate export family protein [Desulfobacterales bacterium]